MAKVSEFIEVSLNEEMNDKQKKKIIKGLKVGNFKPLVKEVWNDPDAIKAAGLDVNAMKARYKEYMKAYNDLVKYTSPEWVESSQHEKALRLAKEAKDKLKKIASENLAFEKKIRKGVAKHLANQNKEKANKTVAISKASKKDRRNKFIKSVKAKLANPGQDLFKQFNKQR